MPPTTGAHHGTKYKWSSGQDGWGDDLSDSLLRLDTLLTRSVKTRGSNTPPGSPSPGDRHIVGTAGASGWSGMSNALVVFDGATSTWKAFTPEEGWDCFVAAESVWVEYGNGAWWELTEINAAKFSSVAAAFAAVPVGGAIFFPPGIWSVPSAITLQTNSVKVRGIRDRSILQATTNPTFHMLTVNAIGFEMHNIQMEGGYSAPTSAAWDVLRLLSVGGHGCSDAIIRRCNLRNAARHNLYISDIYETYFYNCVFEQGHNNAATGENHYGTFIEFAGGIVNNTHVEFHSCGFHNNDGGGCYLKQGTSIDFDHCRFETNRGGTTSGEANGLRVGSTTAVRVDKCHFEVSPALPPASRPESYLRADVGVGMSVTRNTFYGSATAGIQPTYAALLGNCPGSYVAHNRCTSMNTAGIQADISGGTFIAGIADSTSLDVLASKDCTYIGSNGASQTTGMKLPRFNGGLPTAALKYQGDILYDYSDDKAKICRWNGAAYEWKALW